MFFGNVFIDFCPSSDRVLHGGEKKRGKNADNFFAVVKLFLNYLSVTAQCCLGTAGYLNNLY